jgi:hypothetical protein
MYHHPRGRTSQPYLPFRLIFGFGNSTGALKTAIFLSAVLSDNPSLIRSRSFSLVILQPELIIPSKTTRKPALSNLTKRFKQLVDPMQHERRHECPDHKKSFETYLGSARLKSFANKLVSVA